MDTDYNALLSSYSDNWSKFFKVLNEIYDRDIIVHLNDETIEHAIRFNNYQICHKLLNILTRNRQLDKVDYVVSVIDSISLIKIIGLTILFYGKYDDSIVEFLTIVTRADKYIELSDKTIYRLQGQIGNITSYRNFMTLDAILYFFFRITTLENINVLSSSSIYKIAYCAVVTGLKIPLYELLLSKLNDHDKDRLFNNYEVSSKPEGYISLFNEEV